MGNNGNLTCEYTGPNCSHGAITKETDAWWSFNMTHTISEGTTSLTFTYDSEHARILQALTNGSATVTTTYLNDAISGGMEDHVVSGSTTTWNDYLMADGKLIAERTCAATTPTCSSGIMTQYLITDHLGSVGVVTDGTPGSSTFAQVTARESFDAWGRERNSDWSDDNTCSTPLTAPSTRGFTGQEEIASLCLVNLNARIYDPSIGRFTSADSVIPDPYDGQSYNRYTYTDNRPLSLTDPTGHEPDMDQNFIDAHPEMEVFGNIEVSETQTLGGDVKVTITYNGMGEPAQTQDPGKNEVAMSAHTDASQIQSFCDPKATATTTSAQNASGSSSGASTQIETVVVMPSADDTQNGNGLGRGFHVGVIPVLVDPFILQAQGFQKGSEPVRFATDHYVPVDSVLIQDLHTTYYDPNGNVVTQDDLPILGPPESSEAFPIPQGKNAPLRREGDLGKDDIYGVTKYMPTGYTAKVEATVRLYVGTTIQDLQNSYNFHPGQNGGAPTSGDLYSKIGAPGVPLTNAGPATVRNWP